jgi:hypothetical protein
MSFLFVNFKRVTAGIVQGKTKIYIASTSDYSSADAIK